MVIYLVWLCMDLCIYDNLVLVVVCCDLQVQVLVLYIVILGQWCEYYLVLWQVVFIVSYLQSLYVVLVEWGILLWVEEVDDFIVSVEWLVDFCQQYQVSYLFYNYQYEFNECQCDVVVENILCDVICQGFDDSVLLFFGSVLIGGGEMYKVFILFKNVFICCLWDGLLVCVVVLKLCQVFVCQVLLLFEFNYL